MNLKEFEKKFKDFLEKTKARIIQRGRKSTIVFKARIEKRQKAKFRKRPTHSIRVRLILFRYRKNFEA